MDKNRKKEIEIDINKILSKYLFKPNNIKDITYYFDKYKNKD